MASFLYRLGSICVRHRWRVIAVWAVILVGLLGLAGAVRQPASTAFNVPGTQSQQALDLLNQRFPGTGGAQAQIVFSTTKGATLTSSSDRAAIETSLAALRKAPQVVAVTDPFATGTVSHNGRIAYATVAYPVSVDKVTAAAKKALLDSGGAAKSVGIDVNFGGQVVSPNNVTDSEGIGILIAFVVLLASFGSIVAAGIPLLSALVGVGIGLAGILALSSVITESTTAPILAIMIALAVGIDYALFISTRHRQQLIAGLEPAESAARAVATAGSAVCFAGATVFIALAALAIVNIPFLTVMGLLAAGAVLIAVVVALTLVPALLALAGDRIVLAPGAKHRIRRAEEPGYRSLGRRWVVWVTRRPVLVLLAGIVPLLVIASPALHLRLALPSAGTNPTSDTDRRAYDLLSAGFGPGANGPLLLVIASPKPVAASQIAQDLAQRAKSFPDVAAISAPIQNPSRDVTLVSIVPKTGPTDAKTVSLVAAIRKEAAAAGKQYGSEILLTGATAVNIDTSAKLSAALPVYLIVVALLCLLLLGLVFRSIMVPIQAVLGYLLSVAASLGVVTWIFQDGHLGGLLSIPATSPVVSFLPILLLGILFGLAMDYEVFLVSRIREEYTKTGDAAASVVEGYANSARVVAAGAVIMISVFASFIFTQDLIVKSIGFTLAFGVLIDAFVVRMTLVPAALAVSGNVAWWLPRWLGRILPNLDIEGANLQETRSGREKAPAVGGLGIQ
jgi:RND superfamily putative drug exporter